MRIVFLSHYYPPEVNAPASRTFEHCRIWAQAGHAVTVVTCAPNHPAGTLYPGYRNRLMQRATVDGVTVIRVWTFIAANEGFLKRTLNYLSYLVSVTLLLPWLPRADVVVSTSPQFFCGLAGLLYRRGRAKRWILEIRDLWPESIVTVGAMKKNLAVRALEWLERFAYGQADAIVAVTDSFVPHIAARGGAGKITVLKNGVDFTLFQPPDDPAALARELGLEGKFIAAYVGTHGMAHGLGTILEAADQLKGYPRILFLMVGDGAERARLETARAARGLDNVRILGQRPKADMPRIWALTGASLILLRRDELFKKVLPSKMFEAMAMHRPIVLGVEGEAKALLAAAGAGISIGPQNADELAAAVLKLAGDAALCERLGNAGNSYAHAHYDRAVLAKRYLELLKTVADPAPSVARCAPGEPVPPAAEEASLS